MVELRVELVAELMVELMVEAHGCAHYINSNEINTHHSIKQ